MAGVGVPAGAMAFKSAVNSSDEPTVDSDAASKAKAAKGKKRKNKLRDQTAPRQPLTGYVRFLNSRRETLRAENPSLTFPDIMKTLAQEWSQLPPEEKRPYQEAGEQDRERYLQELDAYKKTDAYKDFVRQQQEQKQKEQAELTEPVEQRGRKDQDVMKKLNSMNGFDIPIFTEEFLEHNKSREAELRQLRKTSTDLELRNASLTRIVESMKSAVTSLDADTATQRANNAALSRHLDQLRSTLVSAFQEVPLPGSNERPTDETIDAYMARMHAVLLEGGSVGADRNPELFQKVSGIVDRLDLHG